MKISEFELANYVIEAITHTALNKTESGTSRDWTQAIWSSLDELAKANGFHLLPEKGPYRDEYLLDFVLWEPDYGPRVLIESQWLHWRIKPCNGLAWAFDKLRAVKGNLKVLIFDWDGIDKPNLPDDVNNVLVKYLTDSEFYFTSELYLFVWFSGSKSQTFEWRPIRDGRQDKGEIKIAQRPV